MKSKICSKCKKEKPLKEFHKQKANKDGLAYQCKECNKERNKEYYKNNKEEIKGQRKEHYKANSEKIKEQYKKYQAKIMRTFWGYWNHMLSSYLSGLVKGTIKISPTMEWVLGGSSQEIVEHIFSQLKPGMTRANYGTVWEIDHIIPKALLHYESFEDPNFKKLWCLKNLRPLWKADNQKKGKKVA